MNVAKEYAIAVSRFGLDMDVFLELTPYEFFHALNDYEQVEQSKVIPICESIRMNTLWLVNVQLPRGKRVRRAQQLMKFPWDGRQQRKAQTPEQMKNVMKMIAASTANNKSRRQRRRQQNVQSVNITNDAE